MVIMIELPTINNDNNNKSDLDCTQSTLAEKVENNDDEKDNVEYSKSNYDTEKTKVEDDQQEDSEENSPIPMVAAILGVEHATLSEFYYFRPNNAGFSLFFVLLVSYVLGRWMAKILPSKNYRIWRWQFSFNPGPFNVKEHVCICVATAAGGGSAYATDIIAIQELFYKQHVGFFKGILLLISTQMLGYGLAGFLRKYLVRPANMIWPANLVFASMYTTLHGNAKETRDKLRFFVIVFSSAPASATIKKLGSGYHGVGILNFSLDWNAIGQSGPLFTPWFASVNLYVGVFIGAWIIAPLVYFNNVLEAKKFPFISTHPYDQNGHRYNQTAVIDPHTGSLNVTAYEQIGPVYISAVFAIGYFWSFIAFTSAVSHVGLFYGNEIWTRFKASRAEENEDIHTRMMKVYQEIPNWWYGTIFFIMLVISIVLGYVTEANLPWWGMLMAVGLACIMVLPIGVIQAISNNQVGLNVITEMICGYVLPGRPIANVYFKCYGYMAMYQCLLLVSDLKLGHYMKIPPKSMFVSQLWGTSVGCFVNFWVLKLIIYAKRPFLDGTLRDPTGQWTGYASQVFNTASIVWGLIGPARTFGLFGLFTLLNEDPKVCEKHGSLSFGTTMLNAPTIFREPDILEPGTALLSIVFIKEISEFSSIEVPRHTNRNYTISKRT
ncbi:7085_t:CDS:10 [Ambispora gerdemannii]|uniref:7085_t:CDS:1 n=1 Tax=Ambispora gerdemannii TaxID=144530 RepID=A0A9N8ZLP8_9GLOM|nr:7085_t:CDS:10 [Ambispora gerdemannii]